MTYEEAVKAIPRRSIWRHFKGKNYVVLNVGKHTETGELMVVYRRARDDDMNTVYIRPVSMWMEKLPDGTSRFSRYEVENNDPDPVPDESVPDDPKYRLKKCPFCGERAELEHSGARFWVQCSVCGSCSRTYYDADNAVNMWNGRALESQLEDELGYLACALERYNADPYNEELPDYRSTQSLLKSIEDYYTTEATTTLIDCKDLKDERQRVQAGK